MTKDKTKPASERNDRGTSVEELDTYEIMDGLRLVGSREARAVRKDMMRDVEAGRFDAPAYYKRYLAVGGNGEIMPERVSFLYGKRYKNEKGEM